ncbi:MAG: HD domain-containing protein [Candidatus Eisenbacteria bacterium]
MRIEKVRPAVLDSGRIPETQRKILLELAHFLGARQARGYVVGGFLRDYLLGKWSADIDVVVEGIAPTAVGRHLSRKPGFSGPVVFPRFKTVLVVGRGIQIEICPLEGDLGTDAARRDFTVNCLYADLRGFAQAPGRVPMVDPTAMARKDIKAGLLRPPADALSTLGLDPLRMLRAVRFYATIGLAFTPGFRDAVERMAYLLTRVSAERIRSELEKILVSPRLAPSLRLMQKTGILEIVVPELAATYGFSQKTPYHAYDLFTHLVKTAGYLPPEAPLRLAGLLHDLGKTSTQMAKDGRMVYYGHEKVSTEAAASIMRRLKFSRRSTELVSFLVANHMINYSSRWSDRAIRRFTRKMKANLDHVLALAQADLRAQRPGAAETSELGNLRRRIAEIDKGQAPGLLVPLNGRDVMEILGIREGPLVGKAKDHLLEEALNRNGRMTRAQATRILKKWAAAQGLSRARGSRIDVDNTSRP